MKRNPPSAAKQSPYGFYPTRAALEAARADVWARSDAAKAAMLDGTARYDLVDSTSGLYLRVPGYGYVARYYAGELKPYGLGTEVPFAPLRAAFEALGGYRHGNYAKNPKNPSAKAHLARMQLGASMLREQVTAAQSALARGDSASYLSWLESLREVLARVSQDAADAGQRETPYATVAQETMRQLRKALMKKNPGFSDYLAAGKRAAAGAIASAADSARTAIESAKQAAAEEATKVRVQPITEDQAIRFLAKSHGLTITNPKRGEVDELHVRFNGTAGYYAMPATPGNVAKVGTADGIAYLREWGKKLLGRPVNAIDVELVKLGSRKGKRVLLVDEWSGWHTRALNPRANPSSHIGDIIRVRTGPSALYRTPGFEANYRVLEVSNDPGRARRPIKVASTTNDHGKKGAVHWIAVDQIVKVVRRAK